MFSGTGINSGEPNQKIVGLMLYFNNPSCLFFFNHLKVKGPVQPKKSDLHIFPLEFLYSPWSF